MADISAFEVLGPNMIGPSSSHTAGAATVAFLAQKMIEHPIKDVTFTLYGSFSHTYMGHGTDKALLGGILGFNTDDKRIRDSFKIAEEKNLTFRFIPNEEETDVHPNTVDILMKNEANKTVSVRGVSLGGGKVKITKINNVDVEFTGEYSALIVTQQDVRGVVAHITTVLSNLGVNIAFMRLFREEKGSIAYTIVETDGTIPENAVDMIKENPDVKDAIIVQ